MALSTDQEKVYRLSLEKQKIETLKDAVKAPYVIEFLKPQELPVYSERLKDYMVTQVIFK